MKNLFLITTLALGTFAASALAETSFEDRMKEVQTAVSAKRPDGKEAFFAELKSQADKLLKEFPDRSEPYEMLMAVAENSDPEQAKAIFKQLEGEKVPAEVKAQAAATARKLDRLGKPLDIKFTSVDGKEINLAAMKGKVVLVDFWATWCGPCVAEVPNVVATYNKLHDKGFEIVGISFDQDKSALEEFTKSKEMTWAQFFDGKGWQNTIGQEFGINSIPAMWLVDKAGNLTDMNARDGLDGKVEKLLAQ